MLIRTHEESREEKGGFNHKGGHCPQHTAPGLLGVFSSCTLLEEPLNWNDSIHQRVQALSARLFPGFAVLSIQRTAKCSPCKVQTLAWTHIRKAWHSTRTDTPSLAVLQLATSISASVVTNMHPLLKSNSILSSLRIFSQHFIERLCFKLACACQNRKPPKGCGVIKRHAGLPRHLLWFASFLLYTLQFWGSLLPGNTLSPSGLCASSSSAVPDSCHANALQLWRLRSPRQVAASGHRRPTSESVSGKSACWDVARWHYITGSA